MRYRTQKSIANVSFELAIIWSVCANQKQKQAFEAKDVKKIEEKAIIRKSKELVWEVKNDK